ncbi:CES4A [Branchiostoma lanceolatum]|uniref:Carboxylic ester hydrolase n=1 Tax=Branchiostoma lanceolatum TaxID=7740 RepID=A0A8J9W432_BRALA|nr:CES4A [Branchiostoma lanceolatum]
MKTLPNLLLSALLLSASCAAQEPVVPTKYGRISGYTAAADYSGAAVRTFLGVPFAKPPTGDLRFMPPVEPEPWDGVREATTFGAACPQEGMYLPGFAEPFYTADRDWSEDCLYMDVYAPVRSSGAEDPLAVMVYIHGGGWQVGTGSNSNGTQLAAEQNVIVVTFNYRLGVFGFLGTGDHHAPGNAGLLDQTEAIRWVKDNIANFGGDGDRITIFGLSAGGMAVSLHLLSPLNSGLFHRAITQSGSPFTPAFLGTKSWSPVTPAFLGTKRVYLHSGLPRNQGQFSVSVLTLTLTLTLNSDLFRRAITQSGSPFTPAFLGTKVSFLSQF